MNEREKKLKAESEALMADHGTGMTDGLAAVERLPNGRLLANVDGIKFEMPVGAGEELLYSLTRALRPFSGYSIFDELMMELDAIIDRLMANEPAADGLDKGRAEMLTKALAIIRNPNLPDYPYEKQRQMERYRKRMESPTQDENKRVAHKRKQRERRTQRRARQRAKSAG